MAKKYTFQERSDGFRVVEGEGAYERMVCNITTRNMIQDGHPLTHYELLPLEECTIHSAVGPLRVDELVALLQQLKVEYPKHGDGKQRWNGQRKAQAPATT